jgi:hypothetical protein
LGKNRQAFGTLASFRTAASRGQSLNNPLDPDAVEGERAGGDRHSGRLDLREHGRDVDAAVLGRERGQPSGCLLELALAADAVPATRLVPRDRHVDQPLEEVLFRRLRGAPRQLELLVRGEELAAADRFEPALEIAIRRRRRP